MSTALTAVKNRLAEAVSAFGLLKGCHKVLVAFSGGADSTLLLTLLNEVEGLKVEAAHFNHGIRNEAEDDENFCRSFCFARNIPLHVGKAHLASEARERGVSLEEEARNRRYTFFADLIAEHGFDAIATAHNADDNLETLLFHLARGTSLDGLCGIPPKRGRIIRPLILCSSDQIRSACKEADIPYVIDATNADTAYTRNFLRHKVVPLLKTINPSLTETASHTLRLLCKDRDHLNRIASSYSFKHGRTMLKRLPDAVLHRVLRNECKKAGTSPKAEHLLDAVSQLRSPHTYQRLSLPGGILICDQDEVYVEPPRFCQPSYELPLHFGFNRIDEESGIYLFPTDKPPQKDINKLKNIYKLSIQAAVDSATIDDNVCIRNRRAGDTYRLRGMTRKVKKLLQETPFSRKRRDALPFLVKDGEILWIPSLPPADHASGGNTAVTLLYVAEPYYNHGKDHYESQHQERHRKSFAQRGRNLVHR